MADNTFATAKNIGTLRPGRTRTIQASGAISRYDRIDIIKFTLAPRASFDSGVGTFSLRGGPIRANIYYQTPLINNNRVTAVYSSPSVIRAGRERDLFDESDAISNPTSSPLTFYIKLFRPTRRAAYNFKATFRP